MTHSSRPRSARSAKRSHHPLPQVKNPKTREIKVWVIMDGPRPCESQYAGPSNVYRLKRQAALERRVLEIDGWRGLEIVRAVLLLPSRRKAK